MESKEPNSYSHHSLSGLERLKAEKSLVCLLRGCQGFSTMVELRNENTVFGTLLNCDGFMNLTMSNVVYKKINGESEEFSELHILGKNIRYVHIPDELDIRETIERELRKIRRSRETGSQFGNRRGRGGSLRRVSNIEHD